MKRPNLKDNHYETSNLHEQPLSYRNQQLRNRVWDQSSTNRHGQRCSFRGVSQGGGIFHAFWKRQEPDINKAPSIEILDFNDDFFALTLGPRGQPKRSYSFRRQ